MAAKDDALEALAQAIRAIGNVVAGAAGSDVARTEKLASSAKALADAYAAVAKAGQQGS